MTVDPYFKMVAFDSDEQLNRTVNATIRVLEGATGTSQQADQPPVMPASAQVSTLLLLSHVIAVHWLSYVILVTILIIICR